ncbi:MAG: methyltransferase domain-containing protein, partial [Planctomycetota bacterium]
AAPPSSAVQQLQSAYHAHLQLVSGEAENTYRAACVYYRAELQSVLPTDRSARIAEVGCGFGHLLRFLAEQGFTELTGCDLDADLAAATATRLSGRADVHHAEARSFLASATGRFDLVLAYDILEHFDLDGALAFAAAARSSLRPGGTVVFRTPNMANLLGGYSRYMDLTHRIGFTEQSAAQLLRAAGFTTIAVVPTQHEPGPLRDALLQSQRLHEQMFAQQDRSRPTCFDKNLVIAATVPVVTGTLSSAREPVRERALR